MQKTAKVVCTAIVDNGETLQAHLIPKEAKGGGIVISFDKALNETCDFVAKKEYIITFSLAPEVAATPEAEAELAKV